MHFIIKYTFHPNILILDRKLNHNKFMMSATTKVAEDVMLGGKHSAKLEYIGGGARGRAT